MASRSDDGSLTPPHTDHGRSRVRRGREFTVYERVVRNSGGGGTVVYPMLTATNYIEWALVMQVNLEAQGLWNAIDGDASFHEDKQALADILRAVPPDMLSTIAVKRTAREAWEVVKILRLGVERVHEATEQRLCGKFETIRFKDGETIEAFGLRMGVFINNLRTVGDHIADEMVVRKLLRVVPPHLTQMACSIETLLDISRMIVEDVTGKLRTMEERCAIDSVAVYGASAPKLLLSEEWEVRRKLRELDQSFGSGAGNNNDSRLHDAACARGRTNAGKPDGGSTSGTRDMSKSVDNEIVLWEQKSKEPSLGKRVDNEIVFGEPKSKKQSLRKGAVDILQKYPVPDCDICSIKFSCDIHFNAATIGNRKGKIFVWELQSCPPVLIARLSHSQCKSAVLQTAMSVDGSTILGCCEDGSLWRWDEVQKRPLMNSEDENPPLCD